MLKILPLPKLHATGKSFRRFRLNLEFLCASNGKKPRKSNKKHESHLAKNTKQFMRKKIRAMFTCLWIISAFSTKLKNKKLYYFIHSLPEPNIYLKGSSSYNPSSLSSTSYNIGTVSHLKPPTPFLNQNRKISFISLTTASLR